MLAAADIVRMNIMNRMNIVVSVNVEYVVRHDIYYQRENIFLYHLIFYDDSILYLLTDLQEVFSSGSRIIGNYRFHLERSLS